MPAKKKKETSTDTVPMDEDTTSDLPVVVVQKFGDGVAHLSHAFTSESSGLLYGKRIEFGFGFEMDGLISRVGSFGCSFKNIVIDKKVEPSSISLTELLKALEIGIRNIVQVDHFNVDSGDVLFTSLCLPYRIGTPDDIPSKTDLDWKFLHIASSKSDGKDGSIPFYPKDEKDEKSPETYKMRVRTIIQYEMGKTVIPTGGAAKTTLEKTLRERRESFVRKHNEYNKYGGQVFLCLRFGDGKASKKGEKIGTMASILPVELHAYCADYLSTFYNVAGVDDGAGEKKSPMHRLVNHDKWAKPTYLKAADSRGFPADPEMEDFCETYEEAYKKTEGVDEKDFSFESKQKKVIRRKPASSAETAGAGSPSVSATAVTPGLTDLVDAVELACVGTDTKAGDVVIELLKCILSVDDSSEIVQSVSAIFSSSS